MEILHRGAAAASAASVATFPLMRFVDVNDYGSDGGDDVSAPKQPEEIPGVVVLMKRERERERERVLSQEMEKKFFFLFLNRKREAIDRMKE